MHTAHMALAIRTAHKFINRFDLQIHKKICKHKDKQKYYKYNYNISTNEIEIKLLNLNIYMLHY